MATREIACDCFNIHGRAEGLTERDSNVIAATVSLSSEWAGLLREVDGATSCLACGVTVCTREADGSARLNSQALREEGYLTAASSDAAFSRAFHLRMSAVKQHQQQQQNQAACVSSASAQPSSEGKIVLERRAAAFIEAERDRVNNLIKAFVDEHTRRLDAEIAAAQRDRDILVSLLDKPSGASADSLAPSFETATVAAVDNAADNILVGGAGVNELDAGAATPRAEETSPAETPLRSRSSRSGADDSDGVFEFEETASLPRMSSKSHNWAVEDIDKDDSSNRKGDDDDDDDVVSDTVKAARLSTSAPIDIPLTLQRPRKAALPDEDDDTVHSGSIRELSLSRTLREVSSMEEAGSPEE